MQIRACTCFHKQMQMQVFTQLKLVLTFMPHFFLKFHVWRIKSTYEACKKLLYQFFWLWRPPWHTHTHTHSRYVKNVFFCFSMCLPCHENTSIWHVWLQFSVFSLTMPQSSFYHSMIILNLLKFYHLVLSLLLKWTKSVYIVLSEK